MNIDACSLSTLPDLLNPLDAASLGGNPVLVVLQRPSHARSVFEEFIARARSAGNAYILSTNIMVGEQHVGPVPTTPDPLRIRLHFTGLLDCGRGLCGYRFARIYADEQVISVLSALSVAHKTLTGGKE